MTASVEGREDSNLTWREAREQIAAGTASPELVARHERLLARLRETKLLVDDYFRLHEQPEVIQDLLQ